MGEELATELERCRVERGIGERVTIPLVLRDRIIAALRTDPDHIAAIRLAREALEPFAKAAMGVATFDADFPMDGAALRASFDWYDKVQAEPLKRHSVRRADLEHAANALTRLTAILGETDRG